jgi:N-formylglutamate amidohydrolase
MELAQSAYLSDENVGWEYDDTKADLIRITLTDILTSLAQWKPLLGDN